jgi:hypothetical protein
MRTSITPILTERPKIYCVILEEQSGTGEGC